MRRGLYNAVHCARYDLDMTPVPRAKLARIILPALLLGGLCGAGVAHGLYGPAMGVIGAAGIAAFVFVKVRKIRREGGR